MTAMVAGLCSVTMRGFGVEEVARLAAEAGLHSIEWGGDVHVPSGDADAALRARIATDVAGLVCASYGSYLLADGDSSEVVVARVLDTALDLGAPHVRIWAPFGVEPGSPGTHAVVDALVAISGAAAERDLTVGLEFHGGTLTATAESAIALLDRVGAPNLSTYWQPPYWLPHRTPAEDAADVHALGPHLSHLHVYEWAAAEVRRPLAEGTTRWRSVFAATVPVTSVQPAPRVAFLEFVVGDDPAALLRDARTLRDLLEELP